MKRRHSLSVLAFVAIAVGCGGVVGADANQKPIQLQVELVGAEVVFCFCRHGCGPGLDGAIDLTARNTGESPLSVEPTALHFRGPSTLDLTPGTGLLGAFPRTLVAGSEESFELRLQPDTGSDFPTGSYQVDLELTVGAQSLAVPLGTIDISFLPNDECGG